LRACRALVAGAAALLLLAARQAAAQAPLSRAGWTASADGAQPGHGTELVLDGKANTFWHTPYRDNTGPKPPHTLTISLGGKKQMVNGVTYQPRTDIANGRWGRYEVRACLH
jgi:F5/8 type C domain